MQQLALMSWLMSGDVFGLVKRVDPTPMCPYSLRIQLVEADRCSTPLINSGYYCFSTEGKAKNGNRIFDGVEINDSGMIQAYYFRNTRTLLQQPKPNGPELRHTEKKPGSLMSCMLWSLKGLSSTEASHIWRRLLSRSCK